MTTILVVDDAPEDRQVATGLLRQDPELETVEAENGCQALALFSNVLPELVLTDLHMPEMDGLELVGAMRRQYPDVPVILMTAHGSEVIAVDALRQGAASYVPKAVLDSRLLDTVSQVLDAARMEQAYKRLTECMGNSTFTFHLENDRTLIRPLVDLTQSALAGMQLCDGSKRIQAGIALEEALVNALEHGNLELPSELREQDEDAYRRLAFERAAQLPFRDRRIHIKMEMNRSEAQLVVCDEGAGFAPSAVGVPTDLENLERASGRGLLLMRTFMDHVEFNDSGNQVTMIKRRE